VALPSGRERVQLGAAFLAWGHLRVAIFAERARSLEKLGLVAAVARGVLVLAGASDGTRKNRVLWMAVGAAEWPPFDPRHTRVLAPVNVVGEAIAIRGDGPPRDAVSL